MIYVILLILVVHHIYIIRYINKQVGEMRKATILFVEFAESSLEYSRSLNKRIQDLESRNEIDTHSEDV